MVLWNHIDIWGLFSMQAAMLPLSFPHGIILHNQETHPFYIHQTMDIPLSIKLMDKTWL